jgi:threonine/homoserine/homoserine lactone efflux protein
MILEAVWKGFLTGLWLSMSFGPVFFMLIQTSIKKGIKDALVFDSGVFLSDIFYITIAFFGAEIILDNDNYRYWIALIGGLVLIVFGLMPFFTPPKKVASPDMSELSKVTRLNYHGLIAKGFLVNLLNPSVLFIWFGAATVAFATFADNKPLVILYFVSTLATYFGIDLVKVYLALKLKRFLNPKALLLINRISGLIILVFGVYLIVDLFY